MYSAKNVPLVSVIVPVYKIEKYIRICMECICNQTYKNLQIIVVVDKSEDRSEEICDEIALKDDRIQVIHRKERGGVSTARNDGIEIAKGDFVFFADGDDMMSINCIDRLMKLCKENDADIAQCKTYAFLSEDALPPLSLSTPKIETYNGYEYCKLLMYGKLGSDGGVVWNKLYKREIVSSIKFPSKMYYEDDATTFKYYYKARKVARTDEQLSYYRSQRIGSNMHSNDSHYRDIIKARKIQYRFFEKNSDKDLSGQTLYLMCNDYAVIRATENIDKFEKKELRKSHLKCLRKEKKYNINRHKRIINIIGYIYPKAFKVMKDMKKDEK